MNRTRNPTTRAVAWLGTYSYAMYIFQFVRFRAGEAAWKHVSSDPLSPTAELALRYAGAIVLAVVLTKVLERVMPALRERLFPATVASSSFANAT